MAVRFSAAPRGFTLVEAIIATAIASLTLSGFAYLLSLGARQADANRRALTAIVAAQSKLEQLRAVPWTTTGGDDVGGGFMRRWTILPVQPLEPDTLILQVCVFGDGDAFRPEACVWTVRTRRP